MKNSLRKKPLTRQEALILRLHDDEGVTYKSLSQTMGVSIHRLTQICAEARMRKKDFEEHGEESLLLLPQRGRKVLEKLPITSREDVREAITLGQLTWDTRLKGVLWLGGGLRHAGWLCWVVLHDWARLPRPKAERVITCPHCGGKIPCGMPAEG
jgi:hypothetical protein